MKKTTLAILKPGKYLMLNQNKYMRLSDATSVLLVEESSKRNYVVALHNSELLIVSENEIQIQ